MKSIEDLKYPIGRVNLPESFTKETRQGLINEIEGTPARFHSAVSGLSEQQLETPYRPEGWTVRQVVHHLADSHMNSYMRFRLALTEDEPTIKAYHEDRWAELVDARTAPVEDSLQLIDSLHRRWVRLLDSLSESDWKKAFRHPERGLMTLENNLALYAWHGRHHATQITNLRQRMNW